MKEVVLDTETTGLNIEDGHRIVEIGCIELENQIQTSKKFHCYLNPERKVSEKAFEIHGYSDDFLKSQKKFKDVCDDFLNFIKEKKLIIHNAEFDIAHLNNELSFIGKGKIDEKNIIDTLDLARDKFPGSQINLDALCKRFRIDNSRREKHTALLDCELLAKVYINLIDQKEPTLDFKTPEKEKSDIDQSSLLYCKKIIYPNKDETENHKKYFSINYPYRCR